MKTLHVTRDYPPRSNGGISTAVGELVRGQGSASGVISFDGYRPTARGPCPGPPTIETRERIDVLRVTHPDQLDDALEWGISRGAIAAHCHHDLLWEFTKRLGAESTALTVHVLQRAQNRLRGVDTTLSSDAQDRAVAEADVIYTPSRAAATVLLEDYPGTEVQIRPLQVSPFETSEVVRNAIVFIGRFSDVRGLGELIEALPAMRQGATDATIAIIGGCPDNPKAERRWLRRIEATGVVVRCPGWLPAAGVRGWLERARIAMVPSWIETFGMTACEAMQAGTAVVASDIPALAELVTDGETGVLVPARDAASLAEAVVELWRSPERCATLGRAARAHVLAAGLVAGRVWA